MKKKFNTGKPYHTTPTPDGVDPLPEEHITVRYLPYFSGWEPSVDKEPKTIIQRIKDWINQYLSIN